jgi:hypothetical protein
MWPWGALAASLPSKAGHTNGVDSDENDEWEYLFITAVKILGRENTRQINCKCKGREDIEDPIHLV